MTIEEIKESHEGIMGLMKSLDKITAIESLSTSHVAFLLQQIARLEDNRRTIQIGEFKTAQEAALAYNKRALELNGRFAFLNEV
jgi:hypothetical protein